MGIADPWAALQLDNAVVHFGTTTENLAQEAERVGEGKDTRYISKYRMQDLLTDGYTVGDRAQPQGDPLAGIRGSDGAMYDEVR